MRSKAFDPLEYIESAFLDKPKPSKKPAGEAGDEDAQPNGAVGATSSGIQAAQKFRRTEMSAPRPRRSRKTEPENPVTPNIQQTWESLPKNIEFLCSFYDDSVTANYYRGDFKETRAELIQRLLNPELSLEETSRLLGVCPATVRRYTNRGWLTHHRTQGGQRRFRLGDVVKFVEEHGRFPEV